MSAQPAIDFAALLASLRPRLHRYCARMTGSVLDGEDIVQDALLKASQHFDPLAVAQPEAWLFRIAHNAAMDFLRRRSFERKLFADEPEEGLLDNIPAPADQREMAAVALRTFARMPIAQRSAVILADVLGYEMSEASVIMGTSVTAAKAALHRGRVRLREMAQSDDEPVTRLSAGELALAHAYAERFNARDFDGLRDMLGEEVRLDLVARHKVQGRGQVANYFGNYEKFGSVRVQVAQVEGRCALIVDPGPDEGPASRHYIVMLEWNASGQIAAIRDFRYARYVMDSATMQPCTPAPLSSTPAARTPPPAWPGR